VQDVLDRYGPGAEQRLVPSFHSAGVPYPPVALTFLGFKAEKRLEVWARHQDAWVFIRAYDIAAASGTAGPKLREGDYQVPEGLYAIEALNPNSRFHLSLKLDYPNAVDLQQAALEGRDQLGGDIFLHGRDVSAGCLAMGDAVGQSHQDSS
jgi:murein L,D-transpeptidase YafK